MAPRPRSRPPKDAVAHDPEPFHYPPFSKTLPMLLLAARDALTLRFRHLNQAYGLTEQQWRVIRALGEVEALEIHALSARCRIHSASLSRILPKLDQAGLIARCAKAGDQRCVIVSLKPRGRQLIEDVAPESSRVYAQLARDVGPERLAQMYAMLEELIALIGTSEGPPVAPAPEEELEPDLASS
jgi:homoprotocatechuate degradation regulator HpaR